jgi:hypothetical protein
MGRARHRGGSAPRSILILVILLVTASGALWLVRTRTAEPDFTLGGPLFPVVKEDIEGLLITRQGDQYRLDRTETGYWTLTGAVADFVDTLAVATLLDEVITAAGGPLLPGTEIEDRRYEFNGPEAIRLTVFPAQADPISLALGTINPVAGNYYASGAGRSACFLVPAAFRQALSEFPVSVQLRVLLPGVQRDLVERVDLRRRNRDFLIDRREGRWWLQLPPAGLAALGEEVRDYQAVYGDRRTQDGQHTWILAADAAMDHLIYQVSEVIVREIKSPRDSANLRAAWDLDPPWWEVALTGRGLNPDPSAGPSDRLVIAFGPALSLDRVPALRRGNVLLTDEEALQVLEQPLGALAHRTALTFLALKADAMELRREDQLLLRGERTGVAKTPEGRSAWVTVHPPVGAPGLSERDRRGLCANVVVDLDRIPVLTVLPPTSDPSILADRERVSVTARFQTGTEQVTEKFEVGYLEKERLPAGAPTLERGPDHPVAVGLWFPDSGKLLQIPDQLLVTARSLARLAAGDGADR